VKTLIVTAGLIRGPQGILLAKRSKGLYKGHWEFPGGKLEEDESPEECLRRELLEELGIEVQVEGIEEAVWMPYDGFNLLLLLYRCRPKEGEPKPILCEEVRWFDPEELKDLPMPPADRELLRRLKERWGSSAA